MWVGAASAVAVAGTAPVVLNNVGVIVLGWSWVEQLLIAL